MAQIHSAGQKEMRRLVRREHRRGRQPHGFPRAQAEMATARRRESPTGGRRHGAGRPERGTPVRPGSRGATRRVYEADQKRGVEAPAPARLLGRRPQAGARGDVEGRRQQAQRQDGGWQLGQGYVSVEHGSFCSISSPVKRLKPRLSRP